MSKATTPNLAWMDTAIGFLGAAEIGSTNSSPLIDSWVCELAGTKTVPGYLKNQPWCGTFVAKCLKSAGLTKAKVSNGSGENEYPLHWYRAADYRSLKKQLAEPAWGCVAVKKRTGGNHVFFVVGKNKAGKIVGIGGNQSNKVCYALFEPKELEYFWYGKTNSPGQQRFELPIITNVTATKVSEA